MFKFIAGLLSGFSLMFLFYVFQSSDPLKNIEIVEQDSATSPLFDPQYAHSWSGALPNKKLGADTPLKPAIMPDPPVGTPLLSLTLDQPQQSFSKDNIKQVCLSFAGVHQRHSPFIVHIFLKPEARRQLGSVMLAHSGKQFSFRLLDQEVNRFMASAEKAQQFIDQADLYDTQGDIQFAVQEQQSYEGLTFAMLLSPTGNLTGCSPNDTLKSIPAYESHKAYWQGIRDELNFRNSMEK